MSKLRVIQVASSHKIGLTNQEKNLALAYSQLGDVDLLVVSGEMEQVPGLYDELSTNKVAFHAIRGFDEHHDLMRLVNEFRSLVFDFKPDVVTVNTNWQLLIVGVVRLLVRGGFKIVYTVHGFRHNDKFKSSVARFLIGGLLFLFADRINAPSAYVYEKFRWLRKRLGIVPLGEDDFFFHNSRLPDFSQPLAFCFPGQFRPGKNQIELIEAFSRFIKITSDDSATLHLPGEGELLDEAKNFARMHGLENRVVFHGQLNRKEVLAVYLRCQVAIVPTNSETFGHCIAEPMVLKRILISKPVGVALDCVKHRHNGFIYNSVDDLVGLMKEIKQMQYSDLLTIARHAGEAAEIFRWDSVAQAYRDKFFITLSE